MEKLRKYWKAILLFSLYMSQGMPFGYQAKTLKIFLTTHGADEAILGYITVLAAPWLLKPLWAPFVDKYFFKNFGKRKSWIIPVQLCLIVIFIAASFIPMETNFYLLCIAILIMNFFAATQDIAVDGLAVDLLGEKELGSGNAVQVIGFKAGMVVSSGLLVWLSSYFGWNSLFLFMAAFAVIPLVLILFHKEKSQPIAIETEKNQPKQKSKKFFSIFKMVWQTPGAKWIILFVGTYKIGESFIDSMFTPYLIKELSFQASQIGLWNNSLGLVVSIIGSIFGGYLATKMDFWKALSITTVLRIFPLILQWSTTFTSLTFIEVIPIALAEDFFGGALTTTMFAFMMSSVNKEIGATHFSIFASTELIGKLPGFLFGGLIAKTFGYQLLFGLGVCLSLIPIFLLAKIKPKKHYQKEQLNEPTEKSAI